MTTRIQKATISLLGQYLESVKQLAGLSREIERNVSLAYTVTSTLSEASAGTGSGRGQVEPAVVALIVLLDDLGKEAEQLTAKRNFVKELIDSIDEKSRKQFSLVLHLRYISGLTFEEIAEELEMSVRHIHRLHLEAVDYIASVI